MEILFLWAWTCHDKTNAAMMNRLIKNTLKIVAMLLIYLLVAVIVNLSTDLFSPDKRWQSSSFRWTIPPTAILLVFYSVLITYIYYWSKVSDTPRHPRYWLRIQFLGYIVAAACATTFLHTMFLVAGGELAGRPFRAWDYYTKDYPFLFGPVFTYMLLIHRYPNWRTHRMAARMPAGNLSAIDGTHPSFDIYSVQQSLSRKLGYKKQIPLDHIRYYDVFCVFSTREVHLIYLVNGEKISVPFTTSEVHKWALSGWFVKISDKVVINMVHVSFPVKDMRRLEVLPKVEANLKCHMGLVMLHELLVVGRRLSRKNLKQFLNRTDIWRDEGWGDILTL